MPSATVPHKDNKTVNLFTLTWDGTSIGDVVMGKNNIAKEIYNIQNALYNRTKSRLEFNKEPIIEVTTTDIQYDNLGIALGTSVTDVSAGTSNYATDVGFTVYEATMVHINDDSSKIGAASIVLATAADGEGTTLTEDDDYYVDATRGMVMLDSSGTHEVEDESTLYVKSGTYTTTTSKRIYFSENRIDTESSSGVLLTHNYPDQKVMTIYLPKATITSDLDLTFVTEELMKLPLTITGLIDTSQTSGQAFGYIDITTA
jgi:hypothetical protein